MKVTQVIRLLVKIMISYYAHREGLITTPCLKMLSISLETTYAFRILVSNYKDQWVVSQLNSFGYR
jgi:hypothetical protein